MSVFSFRPVRNDDAEFICRLMNEPSALAALRELPTPLSLWEEAIPEWDADPDEEDFILLSNGEPAGWLGVNGLADALPYIKMLGLLPEYRHLGLGTAAVKEILRLLKDRGFDRAALYTDEENRSARHCYEKCGFAVTEHLTEEMADGSIAARVRMEVIL